MHNQALLSTIKTTVANVSPAAKVILYGSYARGDNHQNSDIDLLILVEGENIGRSEIKNIKYPLYELEFETGIIISPLVVSSADWYQNHKITPFYENIQREGILL